MSLSYLKMIHEIYGHESGNGDFPCGKLQNAKKKKSPKFFLPIMKNPKFILINIFSPTFVPNLVTLA